MKALTSALTLAVLIGCGSGSGATATVDASTDVRVITAQEGHACNAAPEDGVQLLCSRAQSLICISTYSRQISAPPGGVRQVFVCRLPCTEATDCALPGDVCCPGQVLGAANPGRGCVPPSSCETVDGGP